MKKLYISVVTAILMAVMPIGAIANTPQLSVKNSEGEIKVDITDAVKSVKADDIFADIATCKERVVNDITVNAEADADASIKLELNKLPTGNINPLNNYIITVTDDADKVIYNSIASKVDSDSTYREIQLGNISAGESKKFSVRYELIDVNLDMSAVSAVITAKASTSVAPTSAPTSTPKPTATLKPKFDLDATDSSNDFVFDFGNDQKTNDKEPTSTVKEIKKVCGTDIPAGRFAVTGNGKFKITSANGSEKASYTVSENANGTTAVKAAVVVLEDKDVITMSPLDGQEKAKLKFAKAETNDVKATATPVKPTDTNKTNPKTGDGNMGIIVGVAVLAIFAIAGLEILKRKTGNN